MADSSEYLDGAPIPMAIVGGETLTVRSANDPFAEALGTTVDRLGTGPLAEWFVDAEGVIARLEGLQSGERRSLAAPVTNAAGNSILLTAWRIRDGLLGVLLAADRDAGAGAREGVGEAGGSGRASRFQQTLQDVNEELLLTALRQQTAVEEARSESEAKSVFLASVSHELRTPLNSILGYADLLAAGVPDPLPEGLARHVERINTAASHLLSLIEQIIEASRAEFDEELSPEPFDVAEFVAEVVDLVRNRARDRGLELRLERSTEKLGVYSDRRKVRQILLNLLVNAIKFTDEGFVEMRLRHTDTTFILVVRDTGIGMTLEERNNIFRRFWQAGGSAVRTDGGMGIGLWVVRTLVEALGGTIAVQSEPGAGSTFEVELPLRSEVAARARPEEAGAERPDPAQRS